MSHTYERHMIHNQLHRHHISALVGGLAWLLSLALLPAAPPTIIQITGLLMLAVLVFVPLALGLAADYSARAGGGWRLALRVQPFAAAAVAVAFMLPAGWAASRHAFRWLSFSRSTRPTCVAPLFLQAIWRA